MKKIILVTGGCKSGKSSHALKLAEKYFPKQNMKHGTEPEPDKGMLFIATCEPLDAEMEARVRRHQIERGNNWDTLEEPLDLPRAIKKKQMDYKVILIDCLTLWITNLLMDNKTADQILNHTDKLIKAMEVAGCPIILVTNEVGAGIVPENALARQFRDIAGLVNQKIAVCADIVVWTIAGIPITIKPTTIMAS